MYSQEDLQMEAIPPVMVYPHSMAWVQLAAGIIVLMNSSWRIVSLRELLY
jgi:hypothetical protein